MSLFFVGSIFSAYPYSDALKTGTLAAELLKHFVDTKELLLLSA